ncbi:TRAP transporter small permease [Albirhodobacter sp. R86504]|jgi:TRAP-type C4-dicarboxylate transport system permease small subunit|uniref:TRAP transporter small permease n=1 Tax=Albirhodobacter sp. R86504 TaxID=3093848 RepID=UPI00366A7FDA
MEQTNANSLIAEELSDASAFHPTGVNTPKWLRGRALAIWTMKLKLQRLIMLVFSAALTLLVTTQVITRYFFGISLFGIEELATFSGIFIYFLGVSHGAWERGHISASLVELVLPQGRPQLLVEAIAAVITVILSGWMTLWTWNYLWFVIGRGTVSLETGIPMPWVVAVMPVSMALTTFYFLIEAVLRSQAAWSGKALS